MRRNVFLLFVTIILSVAANGQNSIRPNIYLTDMQYYNPAAIAIDSNERTQSALYGKYKGVDNEDEVWNKPMSIWLSHAGRIKQSNSFYTVSYVSDKYSYFHRHALYLGYTKQWKINSVSSLSYGARVVANTDFINWENFVLPHHKAGREAAFNPDLDLGVNYRFRRLNVGVGFKNLFATRKRIDEATLLKNHREVNFHLNYRQNIGRNFAVTPFLLLAHERNTLIDGGLAFSLFNRLTASYALRLNELKSVIVLDAKIYKGWSVGLGYDRSALVSDQNVDFVIRYKR